MKNIKNRAEFLNESKLDELNRILDKISVEGMGSLTPEESEFMRNYKEDSRADEIEAQLEPDRVWSAVDRGFDDIKSHLGDSMSRKMRHQMAELMSKPEENWKEASPNFKKYFDIAAGNPGNVVNFLHRTDEKTEMLYREYCTELKELILNIEFDYMSDDKEKMQEAFKESIGPAILALVFKYVNTPQFREDMGIGNKQWKDLSKAEKNYISERLVM